MANEITTPNRRDVLALATGAAASLYLGGARSLGANMAHEAHGMSVEMPGAFDQAQRALAREELRSVYTQWRAADAVFDTDPTARRVWDERYRDLVTRAEWEHMEPCEAGIEAREFRDWVSGIVPSEPKRCRQVWPAIGGLSRRYAWLNAMFEAALYRHADAWWACEEGYRRAGRRSLKDVESAALDRSRRRAWRDAERAASRIIKESAVTHGDRILRMRAIEVQQHMPDVLAFKYRRMKHLAAIRTARPSGGLGPPKKDDSQVCGTRNDSASILWHSGETINDRQEKRYDPAAGDNTRLGRSDGGSVAADDRHGIRSVGREPTDRADRIR